MIDRCITINLLIVCMSCAGSTPLWGSPRNLPLGISQAFSAFTSRLNGWARYVCAIYIYIYTYIYTCTRTRFDKIQEVKIKDVRYAQNLSEEQRDPPTVCTTNVLMGTHKYNKDDKTLE